MEPTLARDEHGWYWTYNGETMRATCGGDDETDVILQPICPNHGEVLLGLSDEEFKRFGIWGVGYCSKMECDFVKLEQRRGNITSPYDTRTAVLIVMARQKVLLKKLAAREDAVRSALKDLP